MFFREEKVLFVHSKLGYELTIAKFFVDFKGGSFTAYRE